MAPSRLFIYGMQSSGATIFTIFLGQIPTSVVVADLWATEVAPSIDVPFDLILKATIGEIALDDHLRHFRPTHSILFLRHPVDICESLKRKSYRNLGGLLAKKLRIYDGTFEKRSQFDLVVKYEDFASHPQRVQRELASVGIQTPADSAKMPRSTKLIVEHSRTSSPWMRDHYRKGWGLGRADPSRPIEPGPRDRSPSSWALSRYCCPDVLEYYEQGS